MQTQTGESQIGFVESQPLHDQRRIVELDLVRRVRSGDQGAFRTIVERHQTKVFSMIYRILRNREDTEDTAQLVFTKVYFAIGGFDCRSPLLTWIYKIAINECYSHLRKQRVRLAHEVETEEGKTPAAETRLGCSREPGADTTIAARDLLNKLLARVPEEDRLLLILKEVEGHSITELAEMTGASATAIKTKLFRARHKLAEAAERLSQPPVSTPACQ